MLYVTYLKHFILILLFITYFEIFCNMIVTNDIISILEDQLGDHLTYYLAYFLPLLPSLFYCHFFTVTFLPSLFYCRFLSLAFVACFHDKQKTHALPSLEKHEFLLYFLSRYLTSPSQFHHTIYYTIFR